MNGSRRDEPYDDPSDPPSLAAEDAGPRPSPSTRRGRRLWLLGAAILVAAGVAAAAIFMNRDASSDASKPAHSGPTSGPEAPIFEVTSNFADALDEQDIGKLSSFMCEVDRNSYLDYYPQSEVDAGGVDEPNYKDLAVSGVDIRGNVASATVSRTGNSRDATFYYRKETGAWLVCTDAQGDFDAAATSETPSSEGSTPTD